MNTLTTSNFKLYAAKYYDNPYCLSESEFEADLYKPSTVKKLLTIYVQQGQTNVKLLVNTVIGFYNVFEHHAATRLVEFRLNGQHTELVNSVLLFLSLPMIGEKIDNKFLIEIREEFNQ